MSKRLKRKVALMILVEVIFLVALGGFLTKMQTDLSLSDQRGNIEEKLKEIDEIVENAGAAGNQTTVSFDAIYKSKASSVAYMFQNKVMEGYTDTNMQEAKSLLDVDNVLILDKEGNIVAKAQESPANFKYSRYNKLRRAFQTGKESDAFEVEVEDVHHRYYGAKIDDTHMAVIEMGTKELAGLLESTSTWESMLKNITVGLDGFTFAISDKDYSFLYYPNEELIGMDSLTSGVTVDQLKDRNYTWLTINGEKLYCGVTHVEDAYVICAVHDDEILASRNTTVIIIMFAIFAVLTLVITYAFFIINQKDDEPKVNLFKNIYFDKHVGRKIGTVSVIGLLCIMLISFYMQTIFSLSRQSLSNNQRVEEVENTVKEYTKESEGIEEQYNERFLNKAEIAAYILTKNPELINRDKLAQLSKVLHVLSINVFDENGVQIATNSPYTKFKLSDDPKDQSYEFHKLLSGVDYLIQKAQSDDVSGDYNQYIGVTMRDENAYPIGFTQISVVPSKLEESVANMQIEEILPKVKVGRNGVAFAIDKKTEEFLYFPQEKLIGRNALKSGMKANQLIDEYTGYLTINNQKYYASSREMRDYYVFAAIPSDAIGGERLPITIASVCASLIALLAVFFMLTIFRTSPEEEEQEKAEKLKLEEESLKKKKNSAANRWSNDTIHWEEKNAEQKLFFVLKILLGILSAYICVAVIFKEKMFDVNSIFRFVLDGKWAKGVNIFAITGSIMIICVTTMITIVLQRILIFMSHTVNAKGETICRLLHSLVKYMSILVMLYYCFALFGVDTKTLLASAGILTLVIGLGAQTLVADILAGLFIIFEGEFQVGDIVTIGDCRGTVMEIGIRTTKILDASGNVKIISNSDVTGVINMTREYSYSWVDVGIEYGESLERVENVLEKEFPNIRQHLPGIVDGPFYKGVVALADNSVNIRVMVLCAEGDRVQMERDLNREMKLIFDKHNINVPFPQIVINQPVEFQKATEWEKYKARKFNESQRELTGNYVEEEEDH